MSDGTRVASDEMKALLGARIRGFREATGISQSELARRTPASKAQISDAERGKGASPALLAKIESALSLDEGTLTRFAQQLASGTGGRTAGKEFIDAVRRAVQDSRQGQASPILKASEPDRLWPGVIRGFEQVRSRAADLVILAGSKSPTAGRIVLTFPQPTDDIIDALRLALAGGWNVAVAYDPEQLQATERHKLLQRLLPLAVAGPGQFAAYAVPRPRLGTGALVVPDRGAMVFLETRTRPGDAACYFRGTDIDRFANQSLEERAADRDQVEIITEKQQARIVDALGEHIEHLLRSQAVGLAAYEFAHPFADKLKWSDTPLPVKRLQFDRALTEAEIGTGDRLLVKNGLSLLLVPLAIDRARAERLRSTQGNEDWYEFVRVLIEQRARRYAAFHEQLAARDATFIDLLGRTGIDDMVKSERVSDDDWLGVRLTPREIELLLEGVIDTLETYHPHYQIGLLEDPPDVFFEIKGPRDHATVFIEAFRDEGDRQLELDLTIDDQIVASALRSYIVEVLLPTANTDKKEVIGYFRDKLDEVRSRRGH